MITAAEALKIYEDSDTEADMFLAELEPQIRKAAESARHYRYCLGSVAEFETFSPSPTIVKAMNKLQKLGFKVQTQKDYQGYVPRGLADDNGDGPTHYNMYLVIGF